MLSSVLDPSKIVNQRKSSPESFQKFMSGGESPLGSSVVSSAANKIVGFSKVGVSPVTPDISSILNDISTSIISNVDNSIKNTTNFVINDVDRKIGALRSEIYDRLVDIESSIGDLQSQTYSAIRNVQESAPSVPSVQSTTPVSDIPKVIENIQVQVQETLSTTLSNFSKDYQKKIKGIDDVKPKNVLDKFLDLYRNAIGFINFFSDRKNINRLTENLKSIRGIFDTTFNVAKILRETILKIVKQLTNLPSASVSSPGLGLDIKIPGGGLKQAAGPQVSRVGKALRMGALGLGAVGLGAAGAEAAKRYQESQLYAQAEPDQSGMPGNFIEMFSSIVDKFSNVIENLINGTKSSQDTTPSGGGGGSPGGAPPSAPPGGASSGTVIADDAQGLAELGLTQEEWNVYKQGIADVEVKGEPDGGYKTMGGSGGRFAGRYQMGDEAFTESAKVLGISKPSREEFLNNPELQEKMYLGYTISNFRYMQSLSPEFRSMSRQEQLAILPMAQLGIGNLSNQLRTGSIATDSWGTPTTKFSESVNRRREEAGLKPFGQNVTTQSRVSPAPTQTQAMQATSQSISQPAQQVPTTVSLPPTIIDASSPQQQSSGSKSPIPQSSGAGSIEVPFLPTSNPNNFYVLYARSVYNVVDG